MNPIGTRPPAAPPMASAKPHEVRSSFGVRQDPYYWLRDDERANPEVMSYLRAENAYLAQCFADLKPLEEQIYAEIIGRLKPDDSTVPYRKRGFWHYLRYEAGMEYPIFARRKDSPGAPEQIVLDANAASAGCDYYEVGALEISPDGEWLAFCEDTVGRRQYTLRFKNLIGGEILPVAIKDVEADVVWANDNRTVLYVEKDPETLLGLRVKKHVLGSDPRDDAVVFEQTDTTLYTGLSKSKSDRFLFIYMDGTLSTEWRYAQASDPALSFKTFLPRERGHEYAIEHVEDRFVIRTNWQAANFRLMWVPIGREQYRDEWRDLMPPRDDAYIEDFEVFTRYLAASVRHGGLLKVAVQQLPSGDAARGGASTDSRAVAAKTGAAAPEAAPAGATGPEARFLAGDEPACTMAISVNAELDSELLRYTYSSLATPTTVYDYNMRTGEKTLLKRDPVLGHFDSAEYQTELRFAPARDGAQIPVSLIHRKNFVRDGSAALLQYAYGSYGLSMDPDFSSARLSLIDRGFVFAIAHVRGGQEMGRAWYEAGRQLHKLNTFSDFVDVTRFLVSEGYASKDKVAAMGSSAGGMLMGVVANTNPRDYRGIVAQVPFVDIVTTMLDAGIPLTTNEYDEWGDPQQRECYDYMLAYSPYDNVHAHDYPAMLVTTSLWDSQVQYYEPVKWVAKLRSLKTDDRPLLLHVDMESGHGGKSGRFRSYRETAMIFAFLVDLLSDGEKKSAASGGSFGIAALSQTDAKGRYRRLSKRHANGSRAGKSGV